LQAFGPALARRGLFVLCADVISFEDRRANARGIEPHPDDWLQHYNACAHRLVTGDLFLRAILEDALRAVDVLVERSDVTSIGVLGHSMGGTIALWHAAIDERVSYACVSGSGASLKRRIADGTGLSMLELIPDLAHTFEVADVMAQIAPRPLLVVCGDDDKYAADTPEVVEQVRGHWSDPSALRSVRSGRGHDLDAARFGLIVEWLSEAASTRR
jgi:dienelactone hydrolase